MSVSLSPHVLSAVVSRLRAAGCVYAEDEARLLLSTAATAADLAVMVDRRVAGLPLEHVVGWAEFCGLRIAVDPGVFVPAAAPSSSPARPSSASGQGRWWWTCAAARARWAPR